MGRTVAEGHRRPLERADRLRRRQPRIAVRALRVAFGQRGPRAVEPQPAPHRPCGAGRPGRRSRHGRRSEEHTSELQSLMRISYAVFCLKKKKNMNYKHTSKSKK